MEVEVEVPAAPVAVERRGVPVTAKAVEDEGSTVRAAATFGAAPGVRVRAGAGEGGVEEGEELEEEEGVSGRGASSFVFKEKFRVWMRAGAREKEGKEVK